MKRVDAVIYGIELVIGSIAMACIAALVFATVIARYVLNKGILWADEVVVNLFVLLVMMGGALCFRFRKHTEMTLVPVSYTHLVSGISSFAAAEEEILRLAPDLVLLDVNLPRKSGFELCKWLKSRASFPILILTARDTLIDELTALGLSLIHICRRDLAYEGRD